MKEFDNIERILLALREGKEPIHTDFDLEQEEFGHLIEIMQNKRFISGAAVQRGGIGNKVVMVFLNNAKVEFEGLKFLEVRK